MDDLGEKLAGILNDPDSMNRVRQMAESILGGQSEDNNGSAKPQGVPSDVGNLLGADELNAVMNIMSRLKAGSNDSRTQLLVALKPHLSEPRQVKVDTAIKILRLIDLLPYIKESGLLKF